MRSECVVLFSPGLDLRSGIKQVDEPVLVQTLIPETPIETLDKGVLIRFSRIDEMEHYIAPVRPLIHRQAGELGAGYGATILPGNGAPEDRIEPDSESTSSSYIYALRAGKGGISVGLSYTGYTLNKWLSLYPSGTEFD